MIFVRDTISGKVLEKHIFRNDIESIFVEMQMATSIHHLRAINIF